ncbi:MAG: MFS transporter [Deinococcaceae bacterium]
MWFTQTLSSIGSAVTIFVINVWLAKDVYPLPHQRPTLALALSSVSIVFFLASMLAAPIAGAYADRSDRRRMMTLANLINGLNSLLILLGVATGHLNLFLLLPLIAINAVVDSFHIFAFETSYVSIVQKAQLSRVNGMMQTSRSLRGILAPPIAAFLVALPLIAVNARGGSAPNPQSGVMAAVFIDMVTFFISAAALSVLPIPSPKPNLDAHKNVWHGLRFGWNYIWGRRPLFWFLCVFSATNLAIGLVSVMNLLVVKEGVHETWKYFGLTFEQAYALLGSVGAIGGLLGGVVMGIWGGLKKQKVRAVFCALCVIGLGFGLYISSTFVGVVIGVFLSVFSIPIMAAHSQSIWQSQVPPEMQGRVFAVRKLIAQWTAPLGNLLAGVLGGLLPPTAVVATVGFMLLITVVIQWVGRGGANVEDFEHLESLAKDR